MPSEEHPHRESFPTIPSFTLWTLLWVYPALIVSFMVWNLGLSNTLMLFNMTLHRLYTGRRLSIKYGPRLQDYSIQKTKILVSHLMLTSMDYTFSLQNWWPMGVYKILNDYDEYMQYQHAQLEDGTIGQHIENAFGQWYLYDNATVWFSRIFWTYSN